MLAKKKKYEQKARNIQKPIFCLKGLFAVKTNKENVLEQLRKGTLFHSECKSPPQPPSEQPIQHDEECWLHQIKLGQDEQKAPIQNTKPKVLQETRIVKKHLPSIKGEGKKEKVQVKTSQTRRYDRLGCVDRKLNATAAWNKQNSNGIDSNLKKLAVTLKCRPKDLATNDFHRIAGLTCPDRSFDQSILSMSADMMSLSSNPFGNLSFVDGCVERLKKRSEVKLWRSLRRKKLPESEGHFVPSFLLSSLVVQRTSSKDKP